MKSNTMIISLLLSMVLFSCNRHQIPEDPDTTATISKLELLWESDVLIELPAFKLHDNKLIAIDLIKDNADSLIHAFNVENGNLVWAYNYPINNGTWSVSTDRFKLFDNSLLFLTNSLTLGLLAIDPNTGIEKWHRSHPEAPSNGQLETRFNAAHGYAYVYLQEPGYSNDYSLNRFPLESPPTLSYDSIYGEVYTNENEPHLSGAAIWKTQGGDSLAVFVISFLNNSNATLETDELVCVNIQTGEPVWRKSFSAQYELGVNHAPIIHDGKVFVYGQNFRCFDVLTGDSLWTFDSPNDPAATTNFDGGTFLYCYQPPIFENGLIYTIPSGNRYLYCINEETGAVVRKTLVIDSEGTEAVPFANFQTVIITGTNSIKIIDKATGNILEDIVPAGLNTGFNAQLIVDESRSMLFIQFFDGVASKLRGYKIKL
jgi:outer membrane protein assembly factor BamB